MREALIKLVRANVEVGRTTIITYGITLVGMGYLISVSLWFALIAILGLGALWLSTGILASSSIHLGGLMTSDEVFAEMNRVNTTLNRIFDGFTKIKNKFQKKEKNDGRDSSDSVHTEQ